MNSEDEQVSFNRDVLVEGAAYAHLGYTGDEVKRKTISQLRRELDATHPDWEKDALITYDDDFGAETNGSDVEVDHDDHLDEEDVEVGEDDADLSKDARSNSNAPQSPEKKAVSSREKVGVFDKGRNTRDAERSQSNKSKGGNQDDRDYDDDEEKDEDKDVIDHFERMKQHFYKREERRSKKSVSFLHEHKEQKEQRDRKEQKEQKDQDNDTQEDEPIIYTTNNTDRKRSPPHASSSAVPGLRHIQCDHVDLHESTKKLAEMTKLLAAKMNFTQQIENDDDFTREDLYDWEQSISRLEREIIQYKKSVESKKEAWKRKQAKIEEMDEMRLLDDQLRAKWITKQKEQWEQLKKLTGK
jgi:hypothetical protein